jgi:hypothetical protein
MSTAKRPMLTPPVRFRDQKFNLPTTFQTNIGLIGGLMISATQGA